MRGITNVPAPVTAEEFKDVADKAHTHSNQTALDNLTQDVINNSHTHENADALAKVTEDVIDLSPCRVVPGDFLEKLYNETMSNCILEYSDEFSPANPGICYVYNPLDKYTSPKNLSYNDLKTLIEDVFTVEWDERTHKISIKNKTPGERVDRYIYFDGTNFEAGENGGAYYCPVMHLSSISNRITVKLFSEGFQNMGDEGAASGFTLEWGFSRWEYDGSSTRDYIFYGTGNSLQSKALVIHLPSKGLTFQWENLVSALGISASPTNYSTMKVTASPNTNLYYDFTSETLANKSSETTILIASFASNVSGSPNGTYFAGFTNPPEEYKPTTALNYFAYTFYKFEKFESAGHQITLKPTTKQNAEIPFETNWGFTAVSTSPSSVNTTINLAALQRNVSEIDGLNVSVEGNAYVFSMSAGTRLTDLIWCYADYDRLSGLSATIHYSYARPVGIKLVPLFALCFAEPNPDVTAEVGSADTINYQLAPGVLYN